MSHLFKILYCAKTGCLIAATCAGLVSGALIIDEVRANAGEERIVLPWLISIYRKVYSDNIITPTQLDVKLRGLVKTPLEASNEDKDTVEAMVNHFKNLSPEDKAKFIAEIGKNQKK